ncbi:MAG TPA: 50S ribosomal protein L11 methyltransferase [Micropepsaceae bacterium]|jgi:ribosomal protein L11 methyltransferase
MNPNPPSPPLWKASATVAKDAAANIAALVELAPPAPQAVLIVEDPFGPESTVEALYTAPPDSGFLTRLTGHEVTVAPLPDQDWIRLSQEGLPPVRSGRFFIHGAHDAGVVPPGVIPIRIEAGLAFGTGHHETTALCLEALCDVARSERPRAVLDVGCGTGVLAIAAAKLWPRTVIATDIDAVAIEVARENARINDCGPLILTAVADGLTHPAIRTHAPFDLIFANILAGPLTKLAPSLSSALARRGITILSGLLRNQEIQVLSFYRPHGLVLRRIYRDGPWSALVLERP